MHQTNRLVVYFINNKIPTAYLKRKDSGSYLILPKDFISPQLLAMPIEMMFVSVVSGGGRASKLSKFQRVGCTMHKYNGTLKLIA
jgi:hypothetical protein